MMQNNIASYISGTFHVSEKGLVRNVNEDSLLTIPDDGVFIISDGMGGASAGEVASKMITDSLRVMIDTSSESPGERKYLLQQTLHKVNADIVKYAESHKFASMGATMVALLLNPWDATQADICNVGDSRAYCFRREELFLLSEDHTLSDKPEQKHILTNYLGGKNYMSATWSQISVCPSDRFILCSDGLSSVIADERICQILLMQNNAEVTVNMLAEEIVKSGAPDNYSIICIDIAKDLPKRPDISKEDQEESDYLYSIAERRKDYGR